jgi:hypothetical protein
MNESFRCRKQEKVNKIQELPNKEDEKWVSSGQTPSSGGGISRC